MVWCKPEQREVALNKLGSKTRCFALLRQGVGQPPRNKQTKRESTPTLKETAKTKTQRRKIKNK